MLSKYGPYWMGIWNMSLRNHLDCNDADIDAKDMRRIQRWIAGDEFGWEDAQSSADPEHMYRFSWHDFTPLELIQHWQHGIDISHINTSLSFVLDFQSRRGAEVLPKLGYSNCVCQLQPHSSVIIVSDYHNSTPPVRNQF